MSILDNAKDIKNDKKTDDKSGKISIGKNKTKTTSPKKVQPKADSSMKDLYGSDDKALADKKKEVSMGSNAYRILVKPLITEKATKLVAENKYIFVVSVKANKIEVAKAVQEVYGIKPVKVNMIKMMGKVKTRGRVTGQRKDWKKAIIELPKGKTISIYEGV